MTSYNLHRRTFFKQAASVGIALGSMGLASAVHAGVDSFDNLALFLTNRKFINAEFLRQTHQKLAEQDQGLEQKIKKLTELITEKKSPNVEVFMQYLSQAKHQDLLAFAQKVITSLYTGVVGQGDQAKVISYQMALMFEPTLGVITIPTYVGARPEYWSASPE